MIAGSISSGAARRRHEASCANDLVIRAMVAGLSRSEDAVVMLPPEQFLLTFRGLDDPPADKIPSQPLSTKTTEARLSMFALSHRFERFFD